MGNAVVATAPPRDPALVLIYGESKTGKTTDCAYSFPHALWIAAPGATKPVFGVCGYTIEPWRVLDLQTIPDVTDKIRKLKPGVVDALVIDDLSLIADRTVMAMTARKLDKYALWGEVRKSFLELREAARHAGIHVAMNAHIQPPKIVLNTRILGGPMLQGKAAADIPKACDQVLRAQPIGRDEKSIGWPVVYRCTPEDLDYVSGDRDNVTPDKSPMNIGEILRLAGHPIGRLLPWQEGVVEKAAKAMEGRLGEDEWVTEVLHETFNAARKKAAAPTPSIATCWAVWTQRDAYDRAVLRSGLSAHRRKYYGG